MAPQVSTKLTYEDFLLLPNDGRRHEIVDGEHYVNPSPNTKHQLVLTRLLVAIYAHVQQHNLGSVFPAPYDVVLSEHDIVEPDIVFVSAARASIITSANIQGTPDLLIEVLSSNRQYDERVKHQTYERHGVPEYWIVDPFNDSVAVFRLRGRSFVRIPAADPLTSPLLPGFALPLASLFA